LALLAVGPLAGCIGSQTREAFEDEIHARGGGLSQTLAIEAVDRVEERLHVDEIHLRSLHLTPGRVTMEVQVPGSVEDLDSYGYGTSGMFGGGGLSGPDPVARSFDEAALEGQVFTLDEAGVDRLDATIDRAIAEADLPGAYATSVSLARIPGELTTRTSVAVTNVRRTVTVLFDGSGTLIEVQR
jgi:hypothetical protein